MDRPYYIDRIIRAFDATPICAILGPRQCGKTTLARQFSDNLEQVHIFDLENATDLARLDNPLLALEDLEGTIIIDEVQRRPDLFPALRVLVDNNPAQRYLILGSASRDLLQQSSETLAGRITYVELTPFASFEVEDLDRLWIRGGFPRSYLAKNEKISVDWRKSCIQTYLERDIPALGFQIASAMIQRFWLMLTHVHGNILNASELGRSLSINHKTVVHYLDILEGTFMMRRLYPWYENIRKRQVKSPKVYFRDSGLYHTLLGAHHMLDLQQHIKLGASWEGFVIEEVIRRFGGDAQFYFWATQEGAELDLLVFYNGRRVGFEFKHTESPRTTKSMHIALQDLQLDHLYIIIPRAASFRLTENISVCDLAAFLKMSLEALV